ncbi:unnamed protein product [Heligmosomoides polygyrus]|uniref:Protein kinase domain-containing protein n=1 Tax=Heligmosomoides polygyrus TaxID=6339 RepID=A0A3P8EDH3_HELPZ|nr:unnamed protein product [Heligmosomoides polygyrus]
MLQKNVDHRELSNEEIEFVPSDSEHWNSDQDSDDYDSNEDDGNDSLEECAESLDEAGDCEVLNENEAMEVTGSRYYISSEKVCHSLDLLDAECCSTLADVLRGVWPTSRDTTRAVVLLLFAVTTAIFFASSARLVDVDGPDRPPHEVFASGQQSRKDFEQAFMAVLRRLLPTSATAEAAVVIGSRMVVVAWSTDTKVVTTDASDAKVVVSDEADAEMVVTDATDSHGLVNELSIFARSLTTGARISIARPLKAIEVPSWLNWTLLLLLRGQSVSHAFINGLPAVGTSVAGRIRDTLACRSRLGQPRRRRECRPACSGAEQQQAAATVTVAEVLITEKRTEPVGPPRPSPAAPPPARPAAPISISRMAKTIVVDDNVCVQNHKQRSASPFPRSVVVPRRKQSVKRLAGPKRPLIAFKKPVPCMVRPSIVYRRPAPRLFRPSIAFKKPVPCVGMPSIAFEKPLVPCMAGSPEILRRTDVPPIECDRFARNVSVLLKRAPSDARRLAVRQKRAPIRPCVLSHHHRPCTDRNVTVKRNDGPKNLLANIPTRQMTTTTTTTYQQRRPRRRPLAPSQPPLAQRPCEDRWDAVQCWKTIIHQFGRLLPLPLLLASQSLSLLLLLLLLPLPLLLLISTPHTHPVAKRSPPVPLPPPRPPTPPPTTTPPCTPNLLILNASAAPLSPAGGL